MVILPSSGGSEEFVQMGAVLTTDGLRQSYNAAGRVGRSDHNVLLLLSMIRPGRSGQYHCSISRGKSQCFRRPKRFLPRYIRLIKGSMQNTILTPRTPLLKLSRAYKNVYYFLSSTIVPQYSQTTELPFGTFAGAPHAGQVTVTTILLTGLLTGLLCSS